MGASLNRPTKELDMESDKSGEINLVTKVERSPKGLVNALFNSLDSLNMGTQSADDVRAIAHTARQIVGIARLEMDAARMAETMGKNVSFSSLPGLGERPKQIEQQSKVPAPA